MLGRFTKYIRDGSESEIVELKGFSPPLQERALMESVTKEILALANTGRQGFILFGVNDSTHRQHGKEAVPGIKQTRSDDQVEREINDKLAVFTHPVVRVKYTSFDYEEKKIGVMTVLRSDRRPHMVARHGSSALRRGEYFVRQGTVTGVMTPDQLRQMTQQPARRYITLLNFTHPFSNTQIAGIEDRLDCFIEHVWPDYKIEFDVASSFEEQVRRLVDGLGYTPDEWQDAGRFLVSLPGFSEAAAVLLAELHGRMGQFPAIVRRYQSPDSLMPNYLVAEIVNLSQVRAQARRHGALEVGS